jgi:hypothetical protein
MASIPSVKPRPLSSSFKVAPAPKPKKVPPRDDRTLEMLETLHKSTNVKENLKLPQGHRLKLEPSPALSQKRKKIPVPSFNIEFSSIGEERSVDDDISFKDLDDDDDLPDPSEILGPRPAKRKLPSEDSYSDSELDAIIRDLPQEQIKELSEKIPSDSLLTSKRSGRVQPVQCNKRVHILLPEISVKKSNSLIRPR